MAMTLARRSWLVIPCCSLSKIIPRTKSPLYWISWSLAWQHSFLATNSAFSIAMPVVTRRSRSTTPAVHGIVSSLATTPPRQRFTALTSAVGTRSITRLSAAAKDDDEPVMVTPTDRKKTASISAKRRMTTDSDDENAKRPRRGSRETETLGLVPPKRRGRPPKNQAKASFSTAARAKKDTTAQPKKKAKKKKGAAAAPDAFQPPADWKETYALVQELRQDRTAPCDHSGCEALADMVPDPRARRFYSLVALMLSSQTKDAVVADAMNKMHRDGVLTPAAIVALERSQLTDHYLASVGFRNNKATYLQNSCQILLDEYNGDIPPTADDMMKLPGVGPKMAYICENVAWDRQSGIGVDTHMQRLFGMLWFVDRNKCTTPEKTRITLQSWLPPAYWKDVNLLWVGFGQEVQQQHEKILRKALACSRPYEALRLLKRCGMNVRKAGNRYGLEEEVKTVLSNKPNEQDTGR